MQFIDTHAHLNFSDYDKDRDEIIASAFKNGVKYIINVGTDLNTSKESISLSKKYDRILQLLDGIRMMLNLMMKMNY